MVVFELVTEREIRTFGFEQEARSHHDFNALPQLFFLDIENR
jgi:hypothetical protein